MKLLLLIFPVFTSACYLYNVDYKGTNLNGDHQIRTEDAASCQKLCQNEPACYFWSWITPQFSDWSYRKDCYLKAENAAISSQDGVISGPKDCGQRKMLLTIFQTYFVQFI